MDLDLERKTTARDYRRYELFARIKNAPAIGDDFWTDCKTMTEQEALWELDSVISIMQADGEADEYLYTPEWPVKKAALDKRRVELFARLDETKNVDKKRHGKFSFPSSKKHKESGK